MNLNLRTDNKGLFFECELLEGNQMAIDAYLDVKNGLLTGCSFGFVVTKDEYKMVDGQVVRLERCSTSTSSRRP